MLSTRARVGLNDCTWLFEECLSSRRSNQLDASTQAILSPLPQQTGADAEMIGPAVTPLDIIEGGAIAEEINGTPGGDIISAGEGGDIVHGGGGGDVIYGFGEGDSGFDASAIAATRIASGLARPVFATSAPGDPQRLFVIEQHTGQIKIIDLVAGIVLQTPFLDLAPGDLSAGGEQGLLGLAFHPDYAENGLYYLNLTNAAGDTEIWEYTRGPSEDVSQGTRRLILSFDQPFANHNGGWMGFGPDGYLYISSGDGGSSGDPNNNAQSLESLLGKILRIDVNVDDFPADGARNYAIPDGNPFAGVAGADEIFAIGLRNPWRVSFDSLTGDVWIADVGQGRQEEINFIPAGDLRGRNFGWHVMEGDLVYEDGTPGNPSPNSAVFTDPIHVYAHGDGAFEGQSVTGGYVVRGPDAGAQGLYVFADFVTGNVWTLSADDGITTDLTRRNAQLIVSAGDIDQIASFALDGQGRLYIVGLDGEIHRLSFGLGAGDAADELFGDAGDDSLYGGVGDDALDGGEHDDLLNGGGGADDLVGGAGIDIASYANASTGVRANLSSGIGENGDAAGDRLDSVENLSGSQFDDELTGSVVSNLISGGGGADRLNGAGGDDILRGGAEEDILNGSSGVDTSTYANAAAGVRVNLGSGVGQDSDAEGDLLISVENLTGSSHGDELTGSTRSNLIAGRAGDDALNGAAGDDVLVGGAGADTLNGSSGVDTADYSSAGARVRVNLGAGAARDNDAAGDTLISTENVIGTSFNDGITGSKVANALRGGAGDDVLAGGLGADLLSGGAGADLFVFDTALGATNIDTVADFTADDAIALRVSVFSGLSPGSLSVSAFRVGATAADADDRIIYNAASGGLYFDADGNGAGIQIQFAQLTAGLAPTSADFIVVGP